MVERNWREWGQGDHPPMTPQEALDVLAAEAEEWERCDAVPLGWWLRMQNWLRGE